MLMLKIWEPFILTFIPIFVAVDAIGKETGAFPKKRKKLEILT
jgi:hypothetical protein